MGLRQFVLDRWTNLSYKDIITRPGAIGGIRTWVPDDDQRRLAAYRLLSAYLANVAREYLRTISDSERKSHREYGDGELLVARVASGVLGDDPQITVDGADLDLPDSPPLPDAPQPLPDGATPVERQAHEAQLRVFEQRSADAIDAWERAWVDQPALVERQEWLREWATSELFDQRMWESENNSVGLGDSVYVLSMSNVAGRPTIRVYDPGFYFPVLDDEANARGYPTTVHLAWEEDTNGDGQPDVVRRQTWRLGPIRPRMVTDANGQLVPAVRSDIPVRGPAPDGATSITVDLPAGPNQAPTLQDGDRIDPSTGLIVRRYPWQADTDSAVTCYMTDATWDFSDLRGDRVPDLDPRRARYLTNEDGVPLRDLDLRLDFLPVVHVPNTPAGQDHFGQSILSRVLQLLDDIADTDTDTQSAAAIAGLPMVGVEGENVPTSITVAPGAMVTGKLSPLDLSSSVTVLRELSDDLRDLLSVNAQVSAEVLGRVKANEVPSGVALAFGLGPYRSLITVLRLVRDHKYGLVLKFVQRMAQAMLLLPPGPDMPARVAFGSFLPSDVQQLITDMVALVQAHLLSRATALRLLVAAGVDVADIPAELLRIQAEDFEGANSLVDATGDTDAGRAYLGLPPAEEGQGGEEEPPVEVPTLGPDGVPVLNL